MYTFTTYKNKYYNQYYDIIESVEVFFKNSKTIFNYYQTNI